jgi:hypothetical protein
MDINPLSPTTACPIRSPQNLDASSIQLPANNRRGMSFIFIAIEQQPADHSGRAV